MKSTEKVFLPLAKRNLQEATETGEDCRGLAQLVETLLWMKLAASPSQLPAI